MILLILGILLFVWKYPTGSQESFLDLASTQKEYTDQQHSYFQLSDKLIPVNKNLALNSENVNNAFYLAGTSPKFNISQIFVPEDNRFQERDFAFCRTAIHPRNIKRPPKASIGCGWWFVENPNGMSVGALGRLDGPIDNNLARQHPGGRWIWGLDEAAKLEDIKKCKRVKSCDVMDAPGIRGECGYCPDMGYAIPIDSSGKAKYAEDEDQVCGSSLVLTANQCPKQTFTVLEDGEAEIEYDSNGNPTGTRGGVTSLGEAAVIRGTCDPDRRGNLSPDCLLSLAKSVGMTEAGAIAKTLRNMSANRPVELKYAIQYITELAQVPIPDALLGAGNIDKTSASTVYSRIVELIRNPNRKISESAKYLAIGNPNFDICMVNDGDMGPFPPECLEREFRKAGCQPSGTLAPTKKNSAIYNSYTFGKVKEEFKRLFNSMKDAGSREEQNTAMMGCLGTELYKPKPPVCNEPGMEYIIYSSNDGGATPALFLARYISKDGLVGTRDKWTPYWGGNSGLKQLVDRFSAPAKIVAMRTYAVLDKETSMFIEGAVPANTTQVTVNNTPVDKITTYTNLKTSFGPMDIERWNFSLPRKQRNEIMVTSRGTNIGYPDTWEYATKNLETFQLNNESWKPAISLDFFRGEIRDYNGVMQLSGNPNVVADTLAGRQCALFMRRNGVVSWRYGMSGQTVGTITAMFYMNSSMNGQLMRLISAKEAGKSVMNISVTPSSFTPAGRWNHVALVFNDNKNITVYINGKKQPNPLPLAANFSSYLMDDVRIGEGLDGGIGWFHVYDSKLTQQQVIRDMNFDNPTFEMKDVPLPEPDIVTCKYVNVSGQDFPGFDFYREEVGSLSECVSRCCDDERCLAYQFNGATKMCYLKSQYGKTVPAIPEANIGFLPDRAAKIEPPAKPGYVVDVNGFSKQNGGITHMWEYVGGPNQQWTLTSGGAFKSVDSGKCLDVLGFGTTNGSQVGQWDCNNESNQKWIPDDVQRLHPAHAPAKCLEVNSDDFWNKRNAGKLQISECNDTANQKWNVRAAKA